MKNLFYTILFTLAILGASCTHQHSYNKDYEKNKKELARIYAKLRAHISIENEKNVEVLAQYFEDNGNEHDVFQACYVEANYFKSKEEGQKAYFGFRSLLDLFPKDANDEEKEIMRCAYSNLQFICREAYDFKLMWKWWEESQNSGLFSGNNLYMILEDKAWNFSAENKADSCDKYMKLAFENMQQYNEWDKNKESCLSNQKIYYAICGKDNEFWKRDSLSKLHPYGSNKDMELGFSLLKKGYRDSADLHFRKLTHKGNDVAEIACIELAISAQKNNNIDSLFSYFQKYVTASETKYAKHRNSYSGHLDLIYENHEKEIKIAHHHIQMLTIGLLLAITVLLAIGGWYGAYLYRIRMFEERENAKQQQHGKESLESKLKEVMEIQAMQQANKAQKRKAELQQSFDGVLIKLKRCAEKEGGDKESLFTSLMAIHTEYAPYFTKVISLKYTKVSFTDLLLCILIVHGLSQKEISVLLEQDRQKVRSNMVRISKNLTGSSIGRMEDFKAMLEEYLD